MPDTVVQLLGFALLFGAIWASERWLQSRTPLQQASRQARGLALLAGFGGLVGATAWVQNLSYAFAWPLPLIAARLLAVAAVAFGVVALRAAFVQTVGHLRLNAVLLLVYLGPLAVAAVTLHLDRFDFAAPVTYGFFVIVSGMLLGALSAFFRLPYDERGMSSGMLGLIGTLAGLWGLALFLWPAGPWPMLWPWPGDPLTSRLIAAMFLTVATCCHFVEGRDERRTAYILCLLYGAGVAVVSALAIAAGKPAFWAYAVFWAVVAGLAIRGLITDRGISPASATSRRG